MHRGINQQVFMKKKSEMYYKPITPIDGWNDDVIKEPGVYLIDIDTNRTSDQCVLKLYDIDQLSKQFENYEVTKEELQPIIQSFVIEGTYINKNMGGFETSKTVVLQEDVEKLVDLFYDVLNGKIDVNNSYF